MKRIGPLAGLFIFILTYFVVNGSWYAPATLNVKGEVFTLPASFDVWWDSGNGFNKYERNNVLLTTRSFKESDGRIVVTRLGKRNNASLSKDVVINQIVVDGAVAAEEIRLDEANPRFFLQTTANQSVRINVRTNNHSGMVRITVGDISIERDLYVANIEAKNRTESFWLVSEGNQFAAHVVLPRYAVDKIAITKGSEDGTLALSSIVMHTEEGEYSLLDQPVSALNKLIIPSQSERQKRYFAPIHFLIQLFFALVSTWIVSAVLRFQQRSGGWRTFFAGRRRVFWSFFLGSFCCYLVWLLIFWPGVMSVDSLKVWRAAQLPEVFINDHPVLNVLLYSYLFQLWNNPVVVCIFHITMTSLLVAWIFFSIHKLGISIGVILPFFLFTVLSLPVGLYNIVLWKDIPFALLVVFWSFWSVQLFMAKQSGQRKAETH